MINSLGQRSDSRSGTGGKSGLDFPFRSATRSYVSRGGKAVVRSCFPLAFLLAGCQTGAVKDRIVEVDKPVMVQPIKPADVPVAPGSLGKRPPTLPQAADKALSGWCAAVSYMLKADALLRVSAGLPPQELGKYPECGVQ